MQKTNAALMLARPEPSKKKRSGILGDFDFDETSSVPIVEQLAAALKSKAARVIDLFREWDGNKDGTVSKKEFRKAMPELGLDVPVDIIDALFDSWDPDGSGSITLREVTRSADRLPRVCLSLGEIAGVS